MKISGSLSPGERFDRIEDSIAQNTKALLELTIESALSRTASERAQLDSDRRHTDFMRELGEIKRQMLDVTQRMEKSERKKALMLGVVIGSGSLGGGAGAILAKLWGT